MPTNSALRSRGAANLQPHRALGLTPSRVNRTDPWSGARSLLGVCTRQPGPSSFNIGQAERAAVLATPTPPTFSKTSCQAPCFSETTQRVRCRRNFRKNGKPSHPTVHTLCLLFRFLNMSQLH